MLALKEATYPKHRHFEKILNKDLLDKNDKRWQQWRLGRVASKL